MIFQRKKLALNRAIVLLEKLEREHKLLDYFSSSIPDKREPLLTTHTVNKMLKQRIFMLMQGYEDANDVYHLQNDPLYKDILEGDLASQPTISRFENSLNKRAIFDLCYAWIARYVSSLEGRKKMTSLG